MRKTTRKKDGDRGAAAVEFALMLGPLMLLVLGSIDWGYYFFVRHVVTNAAREGARFGSLRDPAVVPSNCPAAITDAQNRAQSYLTSAGVVAATAVATCETVGGQPAIKVIVDKTVGSVTGFLPSSASGTTLVPYKAVATAVMLRQ
jgi:hypothetical protein